MELRRRGWLTGIAGAVAVAAVAAVAVAVTVTTAQPASRVAVARNAPAEPSPPVVKADQSRTLTMSCASQRSSSITSDGAGPTGAGAARDEGWPLTPTEAAQDIVDAEALFPSSLGELRIVPLAPAQRSDEVITTVFDVRHEQTTIGRLHVSYVGNGAFAVTEIERCAA